MTLGKYAIQPNGGAQMYSILAMKVWWTMSVSQYVLQKELMVSLKPVSQVSAGCWKLHFTDISNSN